MNRAAGMADEMGTFVHAYLKEFENAVRAGVINENEVYSYILEQIEKCDDNGIKINIINKKGAKVQRIDEWSGNV